MLRGVLDTAEKAVIAAKQVLEVFNKDRRRIEAERLISGSVLRLHQLLQQRAVITIQQAVKELSLSEPTVGSSMRTLERLGIVREATGKPRKRVFVYDEYVKILDEGTHPLRL